MFKKILIGVVLTAAIGLLAFGAVNRTYAKSVGSEPLSVSAKLNEKNGSGNGGGNGDTKQDADCTADGDGNGTGTGAGQSLSANNNEPSADGTGYQYGISNNGSSAGSGTGSSSEDSQSFMEAWVPQTGVVSSVSDIEWVITLEDGTLVELDNQIVSYLDEQGLSVDPSDQLDLMGFYNDDGVFEIGQIQKVDADGTSLDEAVLLRDEYGRPLWSGGQRGGGPKN